MKKSTGAPRWSQEEIEILKENNDLPIEELLKLLPKRTVSAIYSRRNILGLATRSNAPLTDNDIQFIKDNYNDLTIGEMSEVLGYNRSTISRYMSNLKLVPAKRLNSWILTDYNTGYEDGEFSIEYIYEKGEPDE